MNDRIAWTVGLGRWGGVRVRVHLLLVAFAVSVLWWCTSGESGSAVYGPLCVTVLAASALARELARLLVARRFGSAADEVVLWPMGGWLTGQPTTSRLSQLAVALAPPTVGVVLLILGAAVAATTVAVGLTSSSVAYLSNELFSWLPPSPTMLEVDPLLGSVATAAALLAWVNGALLVINLLPVGSLDAGHVVRAVLSNDPDPLRQARTMSRVTIVTALAVGLLGWSVWTVQPTASLVLWFVAVGMCRRQRADEATSSRRRLCLPRIVRRHVETTTRCRGDAAVGCRSLARLCHESSMSRQCLNVPPRHHMAATADKIITPRAEPQPTGWLGFVSAARTRLSRAAFRRGRRS